MGCGTHVWRRGVRDQGGVKKRNYSAEYHWRLDRDPECNVRAYERKKAHPDKTFVGTYVAKTLAERLKDEAMKLGTSQAEIITTALRKALSDDLG